MPAGSTRLRAAALAATAAALLAPSWASAGGAVARGAGDDFTVKFDVVTEKGKPKRVERFVFRKVLISCDEGPHPQFYTRSLPPHFGPFHVSKQGRFGRRFVESSQRHDGTTKISGEFVTKHHVEGTLLVNGDYPHDGYAGCSSGKLAWEADL